MKNPPKDIIILHMCTINDNHLKYGSLDMEHDKQNFLPIWTVFCPFTSLTKNVKKKKKNEKNPWRYYHFKHVQHK